MIPARGDEGTLSGGFEEQLKEKPLVFTHAESGQLKQDVHKPWTMLQKLEAWNPNLVPSSAFVWI